MALNNQVLRFFTIPLSLVVILHGQPTESVAIIDFEGFGVSQSECLALTNRLRNELQRLNVFTVVERGLMEEILREQNFQMSGCTSNECLVQVGQLLGAHQIISGSISRVGSMFSVSARIVNVETGAVLKSTDYDLLGPLEGLLTEGMKAVASRLSGAETESPRAIESVTNSRRDVDWYNTPKYPYRFHLYGGMDQRGDPEKGNNEGWSFLAVSYDFAIMFSLGGLDVQPSLTAGCVGYQEDYNRTITEGTAYIEISNKSGYAYFAMADFYSRFGRNKIGWAVSSGIGISSAYRGYGGGESGGAIDFPWEEVGVGMMLSLGVALYYRLSPLYVRSEQISMPPPMIEVRILYDTYIGRVIPVASIGFGLFLRD